MAAPITSSLEVFSEDVKRMVESVGSEFTEPDDDWLCVLIAENDTGERIVFGLTGELFNSSVQKDRLVLALQGSLISNKAVRYAFVMSAWAIKSQKNATEEEAMAISQEWAGRFEDHPERIEELVVHIADRDQEIGLFAEIERHKDKPPTLAEWQRADGMTGRFPSLRGALQRED